MQRKQRRAALEPAPLVHAESGRFDYGMEGETEKRSYEEEEVPPPPYVVCRESPQFSVEEQARIGYLRRVGANAAF